MEADLSFKPLFVFTLCFLISGELAATASGGRKAISDSFSVLEDSTTTPTVARQAELLSLVQNAPRSPDSDVIVWTLRNESFLPFQFFAELVKRISGRDREAAEK